jgi:hypothetical protein
MLDQYGHVRITDFGLVYELKVNVMTVNDLAGSNNIMY